MRLPFKSALRIFLSVDIVGSTAFKQRTVNDSGDESRARLEPSRVWFVPVSKFYREIERLFFQKWARFAELQASGLKFPSGPEPEFWKSAGDELLYTKELTDHKEALSCLSIWIDALSEFRSEFRRQHHALDIKSAAWIAGFPINNKEVIFKSAAEPIGEQSGDDDFIFQSMELLDQYYNAGDGRAKLYRDFIGPSIDTGFRLCAQATPRKLMVSIDLLLLLVSAQQRRPARWPFDEINVCFDGRVSLKGVMGGAPYPLFWIDLEAGNNLVKAESILLSSPKLSPDALKSYCRCFIEEYPSFLFVPYVHGDPEFSDEPQYHGEILREFEKIWRVGKDRRAQESAAASAALSLEAQGEEVSPAEAQGLLEAISPVSETALAADVRRGERQ